MIGSTGITTSGTGTTSGNYETWTDNVTLGHTPQEYDEMYCHKVEEGEIWLYKIDGEYMEGEVLKISPSRNYTKVKIIDTGKTIWIKGVGKAVERLNTSKGAVLDEVLNGK